MRVAFLGVIWAGLPLLLFPVAQQWIDSSVAGMLNGAVPLAGAAWAVVLLRRPLPRVHAVGLLIGFAGVLAISWPQLQGSRATMLGAGLVLLAVILYGLAVNLAVPLQQRHGALPGPAPGPSWPPWSCCCRSGCGAFAAPPSPGRRCWQWCRWGCWGPGSPSSS